MVAFLSKTKYHSSCDKIYHQLQTEHLIILLRNVMLSQMVEITFHLDNSKFPSTLAHEFDILGNCRKVFYFCQVQVETVKTSLLLAKYDIFEGEKLILLQSNFPRFS